MKKALFIAALAFWFGPATGFAASVASPSGLSSKSALPDASQAVAILKFVTIDVSTCRTVALQIPGSFNANQFFRTCMVPVPDNATIIGVTAYADTFVTGAITGAVADLAQARVTLVEREIGEDEDVTIATFVMTPSDKSKRETCSVEKNGRNSLSVEIAEGYTTTDLPAYSTTAMDIVRYQRSLVKMISVQYR